MRTLRIPFALLGCSSFLIVAGCSSTTAPPPPSGGGHGNGLGGSGDAGLDATVRDAATDSTPNVDATPDTGFDAGSDADAWGDAATDTGFDAAPFDSGFDAASLYVDGAVCSDASYTDPVQGCGGPGCPQCPTGANCQIGKDCQQGVCSIPPSGGSPTCAAPACNDHVKNQDETDVDCGGSRCGKCADGLLCHSATDCLDGVCGIPGVVGVERCQAPTCSDLVKNGDESDEDCGGPIGAVHACPACVLGKKCALNTDCRSGTCATNQGNICACPGNMALIPQLQSTGGDYCIDQYEVEMADYHAFRVNNPIPLNQPSFCSWNTTYAPSPDAAVLVDNTSLPNYNAGQPQQGANWCDAWAYCAHQVPAKTLCGNAHTGSVPLSEVNDASTDRWYNACSDNGTKPYAYGGGYQAHWCFGAEEAAVSSFSIWADQVQGGNIPSYEIYCQNANVYNMSGNVAEWEDSCSSTLPDGGVSPDAGPDDNCMARGGSFLSAADGLTCATATPYPRNYQGLDVGFRCCFQ